SQMQHGITFFHCLSDEMGIANVAWKQLEFADHPLVTMVKPPPGIERVVENKGAYRMALTYKCLRQVRSDKTVSAGNQNFHDLILLPPFFPLEPSAHFQIGTADHSH